MLVKYCECVGYACVFKDTVATPPPLQFNHPYEPTTSKNTQPMKPEKYYLMGDAANYRASRRIGVRPLSDSQLRYLYASRRLGRSSISHLTGYVNGFRPHVVVPDVRNSWNTLNTLVQLGLLIREGKYYSISSTGREYLSYLRNYLVNKRL
jgi:hypothetical protein